MSIDDDAINAAPQAASVQVFFCEDPRCHRPHVVLWGERHRCIGQFVLPDRRPDGGSFLQDLQNAAYRGAVERDHS